MELTQDMEMDIINYTQPFYTTAHCPNGMYMQKIMLTSLPDNTIIILMAKCINRVYSREIIKLVY